MTTPDDDRRRAEDAAWREIVAHYGERPADEDVDGRTPPREAAPDVMPDPVPDEEPQPPPVDEDRFVPPPPPPVPRPEPRRAVAWAGVVGAPLLLLVAAATGLALSGPVGALLVACFVGGFAYLVATMGRDPREPWDDGSRL